MKLFKKIYTLAILCLLQTPVYGVLPEALTPNDHSYRPTWAPQGTTNVPANRLPTTITVSNPYFVASPDIEDACTTGAEIGTTLGNLFLRCMDTERIKKSSAKVQAAYAIFGLSTIFAAGVGLKKLNSYCKHRNVEIGPFLYNMCKLHRLITS